MHVRTTFRATASIAALLLGTGIGTAGPANAAPAPAPPTTVDCEHAWGVACYTPRQLQQAYDLNPLYRNGFDGHGRTIVIVDPFGSPTIRHDLTTYDAAFGLPDPPSFTILQPVGQVPPYDPSNIAMVDKAGETTGDVELAHAMAPGANIALVETPVEETSAGGGFAQFTAAENAVIDKGIGDVISESFSLPEQNFAPGTITSLRSAYRNAQRHGVSVLAAANDFGPGGVDPTGVPYDHPVVYWPASDPLVTGIGGTEIRLTAKGNRTAPDTAWNESADPAVLAAFGNLPWAGGGGHSILFPRPAYQSSVRATVGATRGVPDVSLDSAFDGGVLFYESYTGGAGLWSPGAGTSAATPEFAGIVAIADQYAHSRLGLLNPALYALGAAHAPGLVDVTHGDTNVSATVNGVTLSLTGFPAVPGYDLATGIGTPDAARLVPELAATHR